ncbi:hypothetical protein [Clostridium botulinum]|uniref:hypothetical protein n=1 Tax=Clostridium botulinum TaxID=1491 RepID=UPI0004A5788F|nr:hypothetical protein [Clostridium botulinum]KEI94965.1 hypothetical protein N496_18510 [Clostridium botulinum A2B3 87]MCC5422235.1 hypothetical protein [Clostridium botulinum]
MKVNKKNFKTIDGLELIVMHRTSAIILELKEVPKNKYTFFLNFEPNIFKELLNYIETISNESWSNVTPKECNSFGSDYEEYYDRKLDNNGFISIYPNSIRVQRPSLESNKLYQFNKRKLESFIYDFRKAIGS